MRRLSHSAHIAIRATPESLVPAAICSNAPGAFGLEQILWNLRSCVDRLITGRDIRTDSGHIEAVRVGDVIGEWRVEELNPEHRLVLVSVLRTPGWARLEYRLHSGNRQKYLIQSASLETENWWGAIYWYFMLPAHSYIWWKMRRRIDRHLKRAPPEKGDSPPTVPAVR